MRRSQLSRDRTPRPRPSVRALPQLPIEGTFRDVTEKLSQAAGVPSVRRSAASGSAAWPLGALQAFRSRGPSQDRVQVIFRGRVRDPQAPLATSGVRSGQKLLALAGPSDADPTPGAAPAPRNAEERIEEIRSSVDRWGREVEAMVEEARAPGPEPVSIAAEPPGPRPPFLQRAREAREMLERKVLEMDAMEGLQGSAREARRAVIQRVDALCGALERVIDEALGRDSVRGE